ncbi:peptidase [Myxococcota bacterium]|nr:peptidase [Myxococcota bacterium]
MHERAALRAGLRKGECDSPLRRNQTLSLILSLTPTLSQKGELSFAPTPVPALSFVEGCLATNDPGWHNTKSASGLENEVGRMKKMIITALAVLFVPLMLTCATPGVRKGSGADAEVSKLDSLRELRGRFADVEITLDESSVSPEDMRVLEHLVKAAAVMDRLFWKQASADGRAVRDELAGRDDPVSATTVDLMDIFYGPWDRLDDFKPFYGDKPRPAGVTFYPADMTADEFNRWLQDHPGDVESFQSWLTVIRREGQSLKAVPYSVEYAADLKEAAGHLRAAADETSDGALKKYLRGRADAFESNHYMESDMDWMDLGTDQSAGASAIEVVIGPYEVYEDSLLGLKSAFEAFITVVDANESRKLSMVAGMLDELEANLPMADHMKNFSRGKSSPIKVVNVVYTAGDTKAGVQTAAFNLPNDERVRNQKGSKKVMLRNVTRAKFDKALIPISNTAIDAALIPFIDFDAYFNFILMHEVSHGLGPGIISMPDGSKTTVNLALKETYSTIEECKADILSVFTTSYMAGKGIFDAAFMDKTAASYLAGIFRSVRFGIGEAHGSANIMQFNYLREKGAITFDEATGRFGLDRSRFDGAVEGLAREVLTIEANGDYEAAAAMIKKYVFMPAEVAAALDRLGHIPVDIKPIYTLGDRLLAR